MSYKPRALFQMIEEINYKLFLPHIQRPFVWDREQMSRLFDSLMRNYPIQTFLFWRSKDAIKTRRFMPALEWDADLSDYYDKQKSVSGVEKTFVLDGQQRLQTLFTLFAGSIKQQGGKDLEAWADVTGGETADDDGIAHRLKFASESPGPCWYRLRDLRERHAKTNAEEIADELNDALDKSLVDESKEDHKNRSRRVRKNMGQMVALLRQDGHFWVEELDGIANAYPYKVILDIFVRVNSGGTRLDAADLMFAAMKEEWAEVEERIEDVVAKLNGEQLGFDKSFALKCLAVAYGKGAELGPEKFDSEDGRALLTKIEEEWPRAEAAFEQLRDLIRNELCLYSDRVVRSYGSFVPIFDFLFHNPKPDEANRQLLRAYYYKAQLFNWYRSGTDKLLNAMHGIVGKDLRGKFPIDDVKVYFARNKAAVEFDSDHLLDHRLRFILLNLVYVESFGGSPFNVLFKGNAPHIDHIYPQSGLRKDFKLGSDEVDHIGNYRFVGAADNIRKRAEKPAAFFARLDAAKVPIGRHLLVEEVSKDPAKMEWTAAAYRQFRDKRLGAIERIVARVVNAELNVKTRKTDAE